VKRGYLRLEVASGECVARAGDFIVAKSRTPFFFECGSGTNAVYEAIHLIVPTHMMRAHLSEELPAGFCVTAYGRRLTYSERILADLVDDQSELGEAAARSLVDAALAVISDAVREHESKSAPSPSLDDIRLERVLRYIDLHLSDPTITVQAVAEDCKMSQRFIFSLLQRHGTTFSALLWGKRLKLAGQWLSTSGVKDVTIKEVAHRVGFKSAAHFTRRFKREFRKSPRAFMKSERRATGQGAEAGEGRQVPHDACPDLPQVT